MNARNVGAEAAECWCQQQRRLQEMMSMCIVPRLCFAEHVHRAAPALC